ncbi:MAG: flagellar protein FlaG [Thermosediminibacteraceae bacterium]|nr:flagellar protein FlaG [Thermosediminibacteraceae bacterium]
MRIESTKSINFRLERPEQVGEPGTRIPAANMRKAVFGENAEEKGRVLKKGFGEEDFRNLTEGLEDFALEIKNTRFEFSIHEETKRVIVRIYDKDTNELLNEIPPEKFLDLIANIWKQVGLIIDKKV